MYRWEISKWKRLGREKTDKDGRIHYGIPEENKLGPGLHLIKLYVEGDGTLTINDWENIRSYLDEFVNGAYNPKIYEGAKEVVKYYANKGYEIQYLTARPYWLSGQTQKWLQKNGFPRGHLQTYSGSDILFGTKASAYKSQYLQFMISQGGN
ncbi:LNS2 domain-containing protein [Bacillus thuringiensis]|uniref:LNS2 domain-containing protein n=1 Tax=Bacillus thuringiensis TaxID=1428 RepID=UPI003FD8CC33